MLAWNYSIQDENRIYSMYEVVEDYHTAPYCCTSMFGSYASMSGSALDLIVLLFSWDWSILTGIYLFN